MTLTPQQQELVEKNHNLIYSFAKEKNLYIDDYYDILAIGLCRAAIYYDNDKTKGSLSTIAYHCMMSELGRYYNKKTKIPEDLMLSLDAPIKNKKTSENSNVFLNNIVDCSIGCDKLIESESVCDAFKSKLKKTERQILDFLLEGMSQTEIAKIMNCTHQYISKCVGKIKKKWIEFLI